MTRQRNDDKSTEFGLWLRQQKSIDSSLGYVASNLDYIWCNYKTGQWMLIEEKRYRRQVRFVQQDLFRKIDNCCKIDDKYKGFHIIIFENTGPEDGRIWLDGKLIDKCMLIKFLQFVFIGRLSD